MTVTRTCPTCGFAGTYLTDRTADHHHGAHSCARQQHRTGLALRRDARAADRTSRDCRHVRTTHVHGTRVAYVKDRCRCEPCTVANTAASRRTQRARTYGRWQPYMPAAPTRERIRELRTAGFGLRRIAQIAGVSTTTLRAITETGCDGRPVRDKVRPETAAAVLAIEPAQVARAEHSTVDATGTRRRLQALVTMGWSPRQLAARLDRSSAHLARTMTGARVTVRTAADVRAMYDEIWDVRPHDTGQAHASRALAARNGWLPPLAWDDIDTDADRDADYLNQLSSDLGDLDEIAIERAVAGDGVRLGQLTPAEQQEVVRRMTKHGQSIREIADQLGTTARTVSRRRRSIADAA